MLLALLCAGASSLFAQPTRTRIAVPARRTTSAPVSLPALNLGSSLNPAAALPVPSLGAVAPGLQPAIGLGLSPVPARMSNSPAAVLAPAPAAPVSGAVEAAPAALAEVQASVGAIQDGLGEKGSDVGAAHAGTQFFDRAGVARALSGDAAAVASPARPQSKGWHLGKADKKAPQPIAIQDIVDRTVPRQLQGVSLQQEHEGNLFNYDIRDSNGNVFRYYQPSELHMELLSQVLAGMSRVDKLGYWLGSPLDLLRKQTPERVWAALNVEAKLKYLVLLEERVISERGPAAAWDGKICLLLKKGPGAPRFLSANPHIEAPPKGKDAAIMRFAQPEIVTAADAPAQSIAEAVARSKRIIADTGHAGTHYHVFMKVPPENLRRNLPKIMGMLQLMNNLLFFNAVAASPLNLTHHSLKPWHEGRSDRVEQLLAEGASVPRVSRWDDPDSEKHTFVAFRYWGREGEKSAVSLEYRGVTIPWGGQRSKAGMGVSIEDAANVQRDYSQVERQLSLLALFAEAVNQGVVPDFAYPIYRLDADYADSVLAARAQARGLGRNDYLGLAALSNVLIGLDHSDSEGADAVHPSLLMPFAMFKATGDKSAAALIDVILEQSVRAQTLSARGDSQGLRNAQYMVWSEYSDWAKSQIPRTQARLDDLMRKLAGY
ncbi:MAG: hypothetical protein WC881_05255 [Elusimicrobiota bacterium]|jgi:hypothetical protein